ncbi:MAG: cysteine hydrolase family protein [Microbacterium sp.]|uniref:cysteine hydrolase family protein n=1 Tax=Microbacterium sp. TaxID=51671 RepID=UPI0039E2AA7D
MRRALLVIDVQNEYVTGALPIEYPPLATSLDNIGRALGAAADAGIPVVVVAQTAPESSPIFAAGGDGAVLHPAVAGRGDLLVSKTLPSAFAGTGLDAWLAARDVDTVSLVGYMTQNCVESTARDAAHRGYAVEVLSDAAGTLTFRNEAGAVDARTLHETVCIVLQSRFAAVVTTARWLDAVADGTALRGSTIYASTRS